MHDTNRPVLFSVSNHHTGANTPPIINGDEPNTYHSYFENRFGEQSLFVYRRDITKAVIYSGDAGWAASPVVDGVVSGLILSNDELLWLSACLAASGALR